MKLLDVLAKEMKEWPEGGYSVGQATDGTLHVNNKRGKFLYHTKDAYSQPSVGSFYTDDVTKDMWDNAKVKNETLQSKHKHKHAEMIALCAEFAQTMENPMSMFQRSYEGNMWIECAEVEFKSDWKYRLKPKTKIINGVEIPDLSFTPKVDEDYFVVDLTLNCLYDMYMCLGSSYNYTKLLVERGLVYPYTEEGKQAAILHAKALLNITGE